MSLKMPIQMPILINPYANIDELQNSLQSSGRHNCRSNRDADNKVVFALTRIGSSPAVEHRSVVWVGNTGASYACQTLSMPVDLHKY